MAQLEAQATVGPPPRTPRRRLGRGSKPLRAAGLLGTAVLALGIGVSAFAVHDEGFQLEGNVTAADVTYTDIDDVGPGQPDLTDGSLTGDFNGDFDWDSLFDANASPKTLPAGFSDADFVVDYKIGATGGQNPVPAFDPSDLTTYTQGSKDDLPVEDWTCTPAENVTNKGDIINAYATVYEVGGERILYFGIEKNEGNGDNNVGLWLLQDGSVDCTDGNFSGHHVDGDLLIVAEITNGGGVSDIKAYRWDGDDTGFLDEVTPVADGADCLDDTTGGDEICAVTNGKPINVPWPHAAVDGDNGLGGMYEEVSFVEGGINLDDTGFGNSCFTGVLFNTRASQEVDAALFDWALGDIDTCNPELALDKAPETQTNNVGAAFDWTITVSNTGDGDADDAVVSDTIPANLAINSVTLDPAAAGTCQVNGQDISCTIDVPAAGSVEITVNVTSTLAVFGTSTDGCITVQNTGTVSVAGDTDASNDSDTVDATICRPTVTKTATGSYTRTRDWTITKSVDPDSFVMNAGENANAMYTVAVDLTETDSAFAVGGTITVSNPNPEDDMLVDVTDALSSGESLAATAITCGAGDGDDVTVPKGGSVNCTYSIAVPSGVAAGDAGTNTATATLNGIGFTGSAGYTFSTQVTTGEPATVNVTDAFDGDATPDALGSATADTTFTAYPRNFACPTDETLYDASGHYQFTKDNTAKITETDDEASATVTVDCYIPTITKSADGAFDRSWDWDITKIANQTELVLMPGQTFVGVEYTVTLSATKTDSAFVVDGSITVANPNPEDAMVVDVTDALSTGQTAAAASIDCGAAGDGDDVSIPAGGSVTCSYSIDVPSGVKAGDNGTNTATATMGDVEVSDTDGYTFALDAETDECVDVEDTYAGSLGTVCAGDADKTFTYNRDIGPYTDQQCGPHLVENTASFETNDTAATGEDDHTITVTVACPEGCTLTQGYWKTHSDYGPAPYDDAWADLPDEDGDGTFEHEDETFFHSGKTWYQVFWTPPAGNPYYSLAHQYMAARLNIINGASAPTAVVDAIADAETLFETYSPAAVGKGAAAKLLRPQFTSLAATLAAYNEGDIGPGHCSEDRTSSSLP